MKPIVPALFFLLFLTACSPYQYLTLDAEKTVKDDARNIIWENDSVKLVYRFNEQPGMLRISAFNKTKTPMYINWVKSAIIRDGKSVSLYDPTVQVKGNIVKDDGLSWNFNPTSSVNASYDIPAGMDFMPPQAQLSKQGIDISSSLRKFSKLGNEGSLQKTKDSHGAEISYRTKKYDASSSPLTFRMYITFTHGKENKEFAVEQLFYASELIETEVGPDRIFFKASEGDKLYGRASSAN